MTVVGWLLLVGTNTIAAPDAARIRTGSGYQRSLQITTPNRVRPLLVDGELGAGPDHRPVAGIRLAVDRRERALGEHRSRGEEVALAVPLSEADDDGDRRVEQGRDERVELTVVDTERDVAGSLAGRLVGEPRRAPPRGSRGSRRPWPHRPVKLRLDEADGVEAPEREMGADRPRPLPAEFRRCSGRLTARG